MRLHETYAGILNGDDAALVLDWDGVCADTNGVKTDIALKHMKPYFLVWNLAKTIARPYKLKDAAGRFADMNLAKMIDALDGLGLLRMDGLSPEEFRQHVYKEVYLPNFKQAVDDGKVGFMAYDVLKHAADHGFPVHIVSNDYAPVVRYALEHNGFSESKTLKVLSSSEVPVSEEYPKHVVLSRLMERINPCTPVIAVDDRAPPLMHLNDLASKYDADIKTVGVQYRNGHKWFSKEVHELLGVARTGVVTALEYILPEPYSPSSL